MRPAPSTTRSHVSLSGGRTGNLSLDENSVLKLMDMLSNIYGDSAGAVIREYPSNAWDSHRAAGQTRPIEVTLPTAFNATFKVKDFGVGLSEDDIYDIYSKYGLSTKDEDDEEIGMLGIGSKSALTYVEQFTLRAVKDGVRVTAVISAPGATNEDGEPLDSIWTSDPVPTDEPNGVEVSIAVKNVETFRYKAHQFFCFWDPADVLIDGEPPTPLKGTWLDEDVLVLDKGQDVVYPHSDIIVMGGVPYPIESSYYRDAKAVFFVPIGAVDPTPSRESLKDTDRTRETTKIAHEFVKDRLHQHRQDALDACETMPEAAALLHQAWDLSWPEKKVLRYRGREIPASLRIPRGFRYHQGSVRNLWKNSINLDFINGSAEYLFVVNFPLKGVSTTHRTKLAKLYGYDVSTQKQVFFFDDAASVTGIDWLDPDRVEILEWERVREIELPRKPRAKREGPARYQLCPPHGCTQILTADELPDGELYFITPSETDDVGASEVAKLLNAPVVRLEANRVAKFQRDFPQARRATETLAELARTVRDSFSPVEYALMHEGNRWEFEGLDPDDVLDPDLKLLLKEEANADTEKERFWRSFTRAVGWGFRARHDLDTLTFDQPAVSELKAARRALIERYPLAEDGGRTEHLLEYVNALHTYRHTS